MRVGVVILLAALGCNRYDLFRVTSADDGGPTRADLLFVVDDSESMVEETVTLAENFSAFVDRLVEGRTGLVDFQLAIATTDASRQHGRLLGDPPVLHQGDEGLVESFVETLLCEAACFPSRDDVEADPGFVCDGTWQGRVSRESLDCLCGPDAWLDHCSGGSEQSLETVLDAMCRAVDAPPEACLAPASGLTEADFGSNAGLLRPRAALIPVVVTDEGDASPRTPLLDAVPSAYAQAFRDFETPIVWAVVAPALTEDFTLRCDSGADAWGIQRYRYLVESSGGLFEDVYDEDCGPRDFRQALVHLGALVKGGFGAVVLPEEPVEGSIAVAVGHRGIAEAEIVSRDVFGQPVWSDGFEYRTEDRTVVLHGEARERKEGKALRVWYLPRTAR